MMMNRISNLYRIFFQTGAIRYNSMHIVIILQKEKTHCKYGGFLLFMVPEAGVEPAQCCHCGILSPVRLPIPPPGHIASRKI